MNELTINEFGESKKILKVLELFAGTRSIGKSFEARGHQVYSVEWDKKFEKINLYADIEFLTAQDILEKFGRPDVIWASPDCTTYSLAAVSRHRMNDGKYTPKTDYAIKCDRVNSHLIDLIKELSPQYYFIENPKGLMRKMPWMQGLKRYEVTYCQYGEQRMKPTDIFTNYPDPNFKPPCHYGDPCHIKAPRGSRTGTQGMKSAKERSTIPIELCEKIVDLCEK